MTDNIVILNRPLSLASALSAKEIGEYAKHYKRVVVLPASDWPVSDKGFMIPPLQVLKYYHYGITGRERTVLNRAWILKDRLEHLLDREGLTAENTLLFSDGSDEAAGALAMLDCSSAWKCAVRLTHDSVMGLWSVPLGVAVGWRAARIFTESDFLASCLARIYPHAARRIAYAERGCIKLYDDVITACHTRSQRQFTFLAENPSDLPMARSLLKALAIARTDTEIHLIHAGSVSASEFPANFTFKSIDMSDPSVLHALYRDRVIDWTIATATAGTADVGAHPQAICRSFAYGVPVIAADIDGINDMVNDNNGLLLPPDTTVEEFVRGTAPYLDSDFRMERLKQGALKAWRTKYDASILISALIEELTRI
ncbi:MAG: hypothetical protein NC043_02310 [Muribaculaceae bacterium]|nr:hypothetical protein [Muribaculaceae bacterium]